MIPDWAYAAAISALLTVIGVLWKSHLDAVKRERENLMAQIAEAKAEKKELHDEDIRECGEWKDIARKAVASSGELASALDTRNRSDEERFRQATMGRAGS